MTTHASGYVDMTCPHCDATLYDVAIVITGRRRRQTLFSPAEEPEIDVENLPSSCDVCGTKFTAEQERTLANDAVSTFLSRRDSY